MRVGVFAPSGSGKTSYLVGLYDVLNEKSLLSDTEYALSFAIEDRAVRGAFDGHCRTLLMKRGKPRFPRPTEELTRFSFAVRHKVKNYKHVIEVLDFPGEAIRGDRPNADAAAQVEKYHTSCDAFIVLLDGSVFARSLGPRETPYELAAKSIHDQLDEAIRSKANSELTKAGTPVAFCVSKLDLLDRDQVCKATETLRKIFVRIFESNPPCPILLAGVSLGQDIETDGEFAPFHLEVPLEFCLLMCAANATLHNNELEMRWDGYRYTTKEKLERRTAMALLDRLFDWWQTGRTQKSYVEELKSDTARFQEYARKTHEFRSLAEEALRALRDLPPGEAPEIYLSGKQCKLAERLGNGGFPLEPI